MISAFDLRPLTGPIRISVASETPVALHLGTAPIGIRLLGQPGPQGPIGPQGETGAQGDPGITLLPTDTPINGGFF